MNELFTKNMRLYISGKRMFKSSGKHLATQALSVFVELAENHVRNATQKKTNNRSKLTAKSVTVLPLSHIFFQTSLFVCFFLRNFK